MQRIHISRALRRRAQLRGESRNRARQHIARARARQRRIRKRQQHHASVRRGDDCERAFEHDDGVPFARGIARSLDAIFLHRGNVRVEQARHFAGMRRQDRRHMQRECFPPFGYRRYKIQRVRIQNERGRIFERVEIFQKAREKIARAFALTQTAADEQRIVLRVPQLREQIACAARAPFAQTVGQGQKSGFVNFRRDDGVNALRHCERHESRADASRRARGEYGRTRKILRAAREHRFAECAFVGIARARGQMRAQFRRGCHVEPNLIRPIFGNADIGDEQFAHRVRAGKRIVSAFGKRERDGQIRAQCRRVERARIGIESRRQINGDDRFVMRRRRAGMRG